MKLSIRVPTHAFDFDEIASRQYAVLGKVASQLAAYEFECDEFIFSVAEHNPKFAARHAAPFNSDKLRRKFIMSALEQLPCLATMRDADGPIDYNLIRENMEMIWYHRNNLNHGRLAFSHSDDQGIRFGLIRWAPGKIKGEFDRVSYEYDSNLLNELVDRASYIRAMLVDARERVCERIGDAVE